MVFANSFLADFPKFTGLAAELELCYNFWDEMKYKNDIPDSMSATLKRVDVLAFPNIYLALKILGTLSITTFECERPFSSVKCIKPWDRSTMTNGRLNLLALLFIYRKTDLTVSEIIEPFAQKSRRIQLK